MPLIRNYSLSLQPNKLKHYCGRERRTNFTRTYRRRRTSVRHRVQTILPGIVRLRLPICNSTRIRGDRTRRDDVAVGKPKIPSSGQLHMQPGKYKVSVGSRQHGHRARPFRTKKDRGGRQGEGNRQPIHQRRGDSLLC